MKLTPLALVLLCACRVVAGTEDLFPCDESCPEGGGSAGGGTAGGGGAVDCNDGQVSVAITVTGPIVVEIDSTGEQLTAGTAQRCLDVGDDRLRASCSGDNSNAAVAWGNDLCADGEDTCDFTLAEDETFVVDGASACD